jgi:hypothetical protein
MKRFQECNKIQKLWRYRWYLLIPFIWIYKRFKVKDKEITPKMLWEILIGMMQIKMNWYHTEDEMEEIMNNLINKHKQEKQ